MENPLEKLVRDLRELESFNGQTFDVSKPVRDTTKKEIELPLSKRLRATDEEAINRNAMKEAEKGIIGENVDGIVQEFVKEKILRNFI